MKVQLLPSSIDSDGRMSQRQHLTCVIVDDCVAFDAGSLAFSCTPVQREKIRDVVFTHGHLDHIAGLPIFLDDLFSILTEPVRVHATSEMVEVLERDVFNWSVYPKFSDLKNAHGPVLRYETFVHGERIEIKHLSVLPIAVNHNVPSTGFVISDGSVSIGFTGDTAQTFEIWQQINACDDLAAVFVECAFPNELTELASASHHLTPERLGAELAKFIRTGVPVYVISIKPMHRETVVRQIGQLGIANLHVLEVGKVYEF